MSTKQLIILPLLFLTFTVGMVFGQGSQASTITFALPDINGKMAVTVSTQPGVQLKSLLVDPNLFSSNAEITQIAVFGPTGWVLATVTDKITSFSLPITLASGLEASFETGGTAPFRHFRGTLVAANGSGSKIGYFQLDNFTGKYNNNPSIIVDDGNGGKIIDFFEQDFFSGADTTTATFGLPDGTGKMPITITATSGVQLRSSLANPSFVDADSSITNIAVCGPTGWGLTATDRAPFSGLPFSGLKASFEPANWNSPNVLQGHFRGNLLALNLSSNMNNTSYFNLTRLKIVHVNKKIDPVDDGSGGKVIDFWQNDYLFRLNFLDPAPPANQHFFKGGLAKFTRRAVLGPQ